MKNVELLMEKVLERMEAIEGKLNIEVEDNKEETNESTLGLGVKELTEEEIKDLVSKHGIKEDLAGNDKEFLYYVSGNKLLKPVKEVEDGVLVNVLGKTEGLVLLLNTEREDCDKLKLDLGISKFEFNNIDEDNYDIITFGTITSVEKQYSAIRKFSLWVNSNVNGLFNNLVDVRMETGIDEKLINKVFIFLLSTGKLSLAGITLENCEEENEDCECDDCDFKDLCIGGNKYDEEYEDEDEEDDEEEYEDEYLEGSLSDLGKILINLLK